MEARLNERSDRELQQAIETAKRVIARHEAAGRPLDERFRKFKQSAEELERLMRARGAWRD
jgi:hypothetical protein